MKDVLSSQHWLNAAARAKQLIGSPRLVRQVLLETRLKGARERGRLKELQKQLFLSLDLLRAYIKGQYKSAPLQVMIILLAAQLYFLNPVDVIVDFLPIGLMDDAIVFTCAFALCRQELAKFKRFKQELQTGP